MDHNSSYGTSWADQWDNGPDPAQGTKRGSGGGGGGGGKSKKTAALEKTKAVAATGLKKAKEGTSHGLQWIKERYHNYKRNRKH